MVNYFFNKMIDFELQEMSLVLMNSIYWCPKFEVSASKVNYVTARTNKRRVRKNEGQHLQEKNNMNGKHTDYMILTYRFWKRLESNYFNKMFKIRFNKEFLPSGKELVILYLHSEMRRFLENASCQSFLLKNLSILSRHLC